MADKKLGVYNSLTQSLEPLASGDTPVDGDGNRIPTQTESDVRYAIKSEQATVDANQNDAIAAKHGSSTVAVAFTPAAKDASQTISLTDATSWPVGAFVNIPTATGVIYIAQVTASDGNDRTVKVFQQGAASEIPVGAIVTFGDGGFANAANPQPATAVPLELGSAAVGISTKYMREDARIPHGNDSLSAGTKHHANQITVGAANSNGSEGLTSRLTKLWDTGNADMATTGFRQYNGPGLWGVRVPSIVLGHRVPTFSGFIEPQPTDNNSYSDSTTGSANRHARIDNRLAYLAQRGGSITVNAVSNPSFQSFIDPPADGVPSNSFSVAAGSTTTIVVSGLGVMRTPSSAALFCLYAIVHGATDGSITFESSADGVSYTSRGSVDIATLAGSRAVMALRSVSTADHTFFRWTFAAGATTMRVTTIGAYNTAGRGAFNTLQGGGGTHYAALNHSNLAGIKKVNVYQTLGVNRHGSGVDAAAETGSNSGSNWVEERYADNGAFLGNYLIGNRATGVVSFGEGRNSTGFTLAQAQAKTGLSSGTIIRITNAKRITGYNVATGQPTFETTATIGAEAEYGGGTDFFYLGTTFTIQV